MTARAWKECKLMIVRVRDRAPVQWNVNLFKFVFLIHAHQKYMTSCIPRRYGSFTHLTRPLLSTCVKGSWLASLTVALSPGFLKAPQLRRTLNIKTAGKSLGERESLGWGYRKWIAMFKLPVWSICVSSIIPASSAVSTRCGIVVTVLLPLSLSQCGVSHLSSDST